MAAFWHFERLNISLIIQRNNRNINRRWNNKLQTWNFNMRILIKLSLFKKNFWYLLCMKWSCFLRWSFVMNIVVDCWWRWWWRCGYSENYDNFGVDVIQYITNNIQSHWCSDYLLRCCALLLFCTAFRCLYLFHIVLFD